ncbi:sugar transferase [Aquabacterium fontiphilum]|uniref:sugar transferase n=1 Tax=Aquabacterium fontiphilum TaxID=450365 RepID=UPI0013770D15|nr:sugar transferase [Aquabacterium fontiphilum]
MSKRAFDWVMASLGLAVLSPVLLLIALAIKLDSPGPVFFRQERVGRHGRLFRIHKFRTMRHDPSGTGLQITVGADARITRVGAFLRASKLDELPQLIDVWRGVMSLVGPRPEVPRYVAAYPADLRDKVLSVRPGITDLASITYRDEAAVLARAADPERAYIDEVLPHKLRLAAQYVDEASLGKDIGLIMRTIWAIVRR